MAHGKRIAVETMRFDGQASGKRASPGPSSSSRVMGRTFEGDQEPRHALCRLPRAAMAL